MDDANRPKPSMENAKAKFHTHAWMMRKWLCMDDASEAKHGECKGKITHTRMDDADVAMHGGCKQTEAKYGGCKGKTMAVHGRCKQTEAKHGGCKGKKKITRHKRMEDA